LVGHINNQKTVAGLIYAWPGAFFIFNNLTLRCLPHLSFIAGIFVSHTCVSCVGNLFFGRRVISKDYAIDHRIIDLESIGCGSICPADGIYGKLKNQLKLITIQN